MILCQLHWDALQDAIKSKDLWYMVTTDPSIAIKRYQNLIKGSTRFEDFDPLIFAQQEIFLAATKFIDTSIPHDTLCPLCEMNKVSLISSTEWIKNATQEAVNIVDNFLIKEKGASC